MIDMNHLSTILIELYILSTLNK